MKDPWDGAPWEGRNPEYPWDESIVISSWAEMGTQTVNVEELYQAFKTRLMAELVARDHITHDSYRDTPLVSK